MADAAPSDDSFIPITPPASESSGGSTSMADTIKLALDTVKDVPDEDAPPKPKVEPVEAKADKAKVEKPADDASGEGEDVKPKPKAAEDGADDQDADKTDKASKTDNQPEADKGRQEIKAPDRLLPDAKEKWLNVPRSVQRDVDNIVRDYEQQIETHKQQAERYESIRPFDELARQNGRDLRESLVKLNHIENQFTTNPIAALNSILQEIGPRKADGTPISLLEVARHVVNQGEQGYQQTIAQGRQQQQMTQRDSETERLRQENEALKSQQVVSEVEARIIAPFRAQNPRYDELQGDIAFFLKSGRIPEGLSHLDKLEAAYAMAERLNPSPGSSRDQSNGLDHSDRVESDSSGRKSIRSSPGASSPDGDGADTSDVKALIRSNLRKAIRA